MYIEEVPNRNSPPAVLLRESYREEGKVKKRTVANLSKLPEDVIKSMKLALKGAKLSINETINDNFEVVRSLPHGHVAVILEKIKQLNLDNIISSKPSRNRNLIMAMITARIINPASKLATARGFNEQTCSNSLGYLLGLKKADEDELYLALDWLLENQAKIENKLAEIHLKEGSLVLYDVTSTYLEGTACELATYGYNRDKKKGKTQIIFGLLCDVNGCPIAVEVFEGNTKDSSTIASQIEKVRTRFGIKNVVWVTDRGILINSKINELVKNVEGLDYITGLTNSQIRHLAEVKAIQLGLFDQTNLVEFTSEDYPNERLIACRNPLIADKNNRIREELLLAVEAELNQIVEATKREKRALKGKEKIALRVGKVFSKYQINKYYNLEIEENSFNYSRKEELIAQEKALDGVYVIRTSVKKEVMSSVETVIAYKNLSQVEEAYFPVHSFRTLLEDLSTICLNKVECNFAKGKSSFETITRPTRLQQKALDLVGVTLICTQ